MKPGDAIELYGCLYKVISVDDKVTFRHVKEIDGACGHMCAPQQILSLEQIEEAKNFPVRPRE